MSEKTSMFELLNERLSEEEIIKITTSYDNKFNELEEAKKQRDEEIQRLNNQLQQKENIIKEVREYIELVETLAINDKRKIFSMSALKRILDKGE